MVIDNPYEVRCEVCGRVERGAWADSVIFGGLHLDGRRPEEPAWPDACLSCGYVGFRLHDSLRGKPSVKGLREFRGFVTLLTDYGLDGLVSEGEVERTARIILLRKVTNVVRSDSYQRQLHAKPDYIDDPELSSVVNRLICRTMIEDEAGSMQATGWTWMEAAWVCDDWALTGEGARRCREFALNSFRAVKELGLSFVVQRSVEHAILTDILRRLERFAEAHRECEHGLAVVAEDEAQQDRERELGTNRHVRTRRVLAFQQELIRRRDNDDHTIDEVKDDIERHFWPGATRVWG